MSIIVHSRQKNEGEAMMEEGVNEHQTAYCRKGWIYMQSKGRRTKKVGVKGREEKYRNKNSGVTRGSLLLHYIPVYLYIYMRRSWKREILRVRDAVLSKNIFCGHGSRAGWDALDIDVGCSFSIFILYFSFYCCLECIT